MKGNKNLYVDMKTNRKLSGVVREAIDTFPGGLCFAMSDGRPVLVNRKMNYLFLKLTGHTILDAEEAWKELRVFPECQDGNATATLRQVQTGDLSRLEFHFPDDSVWQFSRKVLRDENYDFIQLEALEITELQHLSRELEEENLRLSDLRKRQQELLQNIAETNRKKELLAAKMRIHDELGQSVLSTKRALDAGKTDQEVLKGWKDSIRDLRNIPLSEEEESPEKELVRVADMIGCKIEFQGERPENRKMKQLLYAAVREALTNAVRHAGADRLLVQTQRNGQSYHIVISDNGKMKAEKVKAGSGLGNLQVRLEEEGASMKIVCRNGVMLILELPGEAGKERTEE